MPACHNVFAIPELAEAILLELPMRDLLCCAQQVCRRWKAMVETSSALQQSLFLKPITSETLVQSTNPNEWIAVHAGERHLQASAVYEHPFFHQIFGLWRKESGLVHWTKIEAVEALDLFRDLSKTPGKWRQHLLTQPPVQEITIMDLRGTHKQLSSGAGITLGQLWDTLASLASPVNIGGWYGWRSYDSYHQLRAVKLLEPGCTKEVDSSGVNREVYYLGDDDWQADSDEGSPGRCNDAEGRLDDM
jgi:hypothetical protein